VLPIDPQSAIDRLLEFQREIRARVIASRTQRQLAAVARDTAADTIYGIDAAVDPVIDTFFEEWGKTTPLVLIAEGIEDETGREGVKTFPRGTPDDRALIRVIVDPIDGTRGIMYDKRSAWSLAGVAPNHGPETRLRDIEAAAMTELPTTKMGQADVLWAIRGAGVRGQREDLTTSAFNPIEMRASKAEEIDHGFATISSFFPGTKVLAAELMEYIAHHLAGKTDIARATVFDDQYISTGGQFYELIVGHDRFIADLRPLFYALQGQGKGLCCHPYDCASLLVAEEAGVILTDGNGWKLDGPLDVTSGISWAAYANQTLRNKIEPLLLRFFSKRGG
jgi:hypothetical protein